MLAVFMEEIQQEADRRFPQLLHSLLEVMPRQVCILPPSPCCYARCIRTIEKAVVQLKPHIEPRTGLIAYYSYNPYVERLCELVDTITALKDDIEVLKLKPCNACMECEHGLDDFLARCRVIREPTTTTASYAVVAGSDPR